MANSLNGTHIDESDENWPLRLTGANVSGSESVKKVKSLRLVTSLMAPGAAFTADPLSGTAPLTVQFTDASTGTAPFTYAWDFNNDGITDNTTQSPSYTYATAGTYTVNLTVTNGAGSDSELKTDHIIVSEAPPLTVLNVNTGIRYATIQGAVTAATAGDEIVVGDGSYTENVVIDKSLTIRSENGTATTTVTAVDISKSAFTVNANAVTINGFSVRGTTNSNIGGIEVKNVNSALITNNDVSSCSVGIRLAGTATNNTVTGNTIHGNSKYGLSIRDSAFGNFAYKNIFSANTSKDICIKDTTHDNALWLNDVNSSGVEILTSVVSHSPSPLTYTYNSGIYTSYLGNRYVTYAGADADGNGVGDSVFTASSYTDSYPLMTQSANYVETALPPAPVAIFSGTPLSGDAPLTVQFTDASTGTITGYAWDFDNDGTTDSTVPEPEPPVPQRRHLHREPHRDECWW